MDSQRSHMVLAVVLGLIGIVLLIAAIIYFAEPAKSLPGFMGQVDGISAHRTKHGVAALVIGVASLAAAGFLASRGRRTESAPPPSES